MSRYSPRYGLSGQTVGNLRGRWLRMGEDAMGFGDFDAFVKWASENGYTPHAKLQKRDESKPHGPENSRWVCCPTDDKTGPGNPCEKCAMGDSCARICKPRADYWDAAMRKVRRALGVDGP